MVPIVASGDSRELPGATRYPADDTNRTRTHSRHHTEPIAGRLAAAGRAQRGGSPVVSRDEWWQARAALKEIMKGVAHEVKNPLGGIRGAAQLLAGELGKSTEYTTSSFLRWSTAYVGGPVGPERMESEPTISMNHRARPPAHRG